MVTVTLDEITLNAVKAALDERIYALEVEIKRSQAIASSPMLSGAPLELTEDAQRALVWNIAALHETKLAREQLSDPEVTADHPADASYHDWQIAGPA